MVLDVPGKTITLFGKGNVKQKDMDLSADSISLDQSTQMVTAAGRKDTAGNVIGKPVMVQPTVKYRRIS